MTCVHDRQCSPDPSIDDLDGHHRCALHEKLDDTLKDPEPDACRVRSTTPGLPHATSPSSGSIDVASVIDAQHRDGALDLVDSIQDAVAPAAGAVDPGEFVT
jgi:hypothetical protein